MNIQNLYGEKAIIGKFYLYKGYTLVSIKIPNYDMPDKWKFDNYVLICKSQQLAEQGIWVHISDDLACAKSWVNLQF